MSKDKFSNIVSLKMEAIVFVILQICFATRTVLKIREHHSGIFSSFSWGRFDHVTRLEQSCASEDIWSIMIII